ncbi:MULTISPECIES: DUF6308 family protein [Protofrankia]|uniref:Uncharacterized protein n=2 Tax=Protofrankia TaxID=2994361 RepID=F8AXK8_9ACTN|nr:MULTISPECIES: DUF6308 family protein [Protofrankia]AEH10359.1 hypothetical protein FsymDg_3047 [Candidatus Protofrankia datiscae]KLL12379.1 hypothetical protein FrCorBMG51_05055 [Protofrankia coriariae]
MRLAMGTREVFDAESLLEEYLGPRKRGLRYAYPYYDGLTTNGDSDLLCTGDLLAPCLLGVQVDVDRMHTLTALTPLLQRGLDKLPPGIELIEADEITLDLVAALYDPLDDPDVSDRDVKGSLIAKVLHRKRPALVPLFDSKVRIFYQHERCIPPSPRDGRSWREYMQLLVRAMQYDLKENADEFHRLSALVPRNGPPLTPLRILDIVVWMSSAV